MRTRTPATRLPSMARPPLTDLSVAATARLPGRSEGLLGSLPLVLTVAVAVAAEKPAGVPAAVLASPGLSSADLLGVNEWQEGL